MSVESEHPLRNITKRPSNVTHRITPRRHYPKVVEGKSALQTYEAEISRTSHGQVVPTLCSQLLAEREIIQQRSLGKVQRLSALKQPPPQDPLPRAAERSNSGQYSESEDAEKEPSPHFETAVARQDNTTIGGRKGPGRPRKDHQRARVTELKDGNYTWGQIKTKLDLEFKQQKSKDAYRALYGASPTSQR
jgi:hypothetical protein